MNAAIRVNALEGSAIGGGGWGAASTHTPDELIQLGPTGKMRSARKRTLPGLCR